MEKVLEIPGSDRPMKLQIWDTAGSERYKSLNRIYFRDAAAALVVYDVTSKNSLFAEAEYWIRDLQENSPPNVIIALAGNKSDLHDSQEVSQLELQNFADVHNISVFGECSAL